MTTKWQDATKYIGGSKEAEEQIFIKLGNDAVKSIANFKAESTGYAHRPQHAKTLAGIKNAKLVISHIIAEDLRYGFISPGMSYTTYIRFSNATGAISNDDSRPADLRGVALRIFLIDGRTQDLLMTNAEEHHAKDAVEAMAISFAFSNKNKLKAIANLISSVGIGTAFRMIRKLSGQMKKPVESLATETFWSRAPLRIGDTVVKYRLSPLESKSKKPKKEKYLTNELAQRLNLEDVKYSLQVQRYINEELTPLEDARKAWRSPFENLGVLIVPKQKLEDEKAFFEPMAFNPWNVCSIDIEPMGNMNRARKMVYPSSVAARAQQQGTHYNPMFK